MPFNVLLLFTFIYLHLFYVVTQHYGMTYKNKSEALQL
jgi:hypothetical protein